MKFHLQKLPFLGSKAAMKAGGFDQMKVSGKTHRAKKALAIFSELFVWKSLIAENRPSSSQNSFQAEISYEGEGVPFDQMKASGKKPHRSEKR